MEKKFKSRAQLAEDRALYSARIDLGEVLDRVLEGIALGHVHGLLGLHGRLHRLHGRHGFGRARERVVYKARDYFLSPRDVMMNREDETVSADNESREAPQKGEEAIHLLNRKTASARTARQQLRLSPLR